MNNILLYSATFMILISTTALEDVRKNFFQINSVDQADIYINQLQDDESLESRGYAASLNFIKSRYVKFPYTKMKFFKLGKKALDDLIKENPQNVEIRYLRFLMQKQIPEFLGYNKHLNEDFEVIILGIEKDNLPNEIKSIILTNMLGVEKLNPLEKEKINQLLNQL